MVENLKCRRIYCKIKITEYRIEHEQLIHGIWKIEKETANKSQI